MKPVEKNKVESLLMTAYKMPYSPTIFENDYALSQQYQRENKETTEQTETDNKSDNNEKSNEQEDNEEDDNDEEGDEDEDEDDEEDATTTAETISSYQNVLTITNIQMQQRKKHPRKPQKNRIVITR